MKAAIRMIDPGLQSSVQDLGRPGWAHLGVPSSGAADPISLRVGNRLVGNPDSAAAIEVPLRSCLMSFTHAATIAITGAVEQGVLTLASGQRQDAPAWRRLDVPARSTLRIDIAAPGARAYLCVAGGIDLPVVLGSRSACLSTPLDALAAGPLRAGSKLPIGSVSLAGPCRTLDAHAIHSLREHLARRTLRVITHPDVAAIGDLDKLSLRVSSQSNRMGVRLETPVPSAAVGSNMITQPTACGAIQVPGDARPIILGVDRPTTGGYPVIATVVFADLPLLGQLRPGDIVRFQVIGVPEALMLHREQQQWLNTLCPPRPELPRTIDLNCDLGEGMPMEHDEALMRLVTSVNIACGGHAGDDATMQRSVLAAMKHGCRVGAHPSFPDRANFGRAMLSMPIEDLERSLVEQITALMRIARGAGARVEYVKPHGALYNAAMIDPDLADCLARAVRACDPTLPLVGLAGAAALSRWNAAGLAVISEAFADRRYEPDGTLRDRRHPDAVISDPGQAAAQALSIASRNSTGAQSICVHSDSPHAEAFLRAIRERLAAAGIEVSAASLNP